MTICLKIELNQISIMETKIFGNVEYITGVKIPSKLFRKTKKIYLKVDKQGITFLGKTLAWDNIKNVELKFFNANPYIQIDNSGTLHNFFFESKFYYRKKVPWFGASKFLTQEFVKLLEEKELFTSKKLEELVDQNTESLLMHKIWNNFFWVFPPFLIIISIIMIILGLNATSS